MRKIWQQAGERKRAQAAGTARSRLPPPVGPNRSLMIDEGSAPDPNPSGRDLRRRASCADLLSSPLSLRFLPLLPGLRPRKFPYNGNCFHSAPRSNLFPAESGGSMDCSLYHFRRTGVSGADSNSYHRCTRSPRGVCREVQRRPTHPSNRLRSGSNSGCSCSCAGRRAPRISTSNPSAASDSAAGI
jgi:hypothetical protein